ncbi:MAG: transglycosylase SLT domain-containing protein [Betaproteobacteria bacterium]
MNRRSILVFLGTLLFLSPWKSAVADIFQYTDENGVVHFSNVSVGGSKKYRKIKEPKTNRRATPASYTAPAPSQSESASNDSMAGLYADIINSACSRHGVDPALVHAIVKVESDFNPLALSRKGAMGLMQLMPQTAAELNVQNTFSPHENIDGGVKYLKYLIDRYEGNLTLALAAYNSGETAVKKWGTVPPFPETQNYVQRILKLYNGTGCSITRQYTIYVGYGEDGALLFTDDPSKHKNKNLKQKTVKHL